MDSNPAPEEPVVASRYRLEQLVGTGASSQVWRAWDVRLERTVAVKLTQLPDEEAKGRFQREARLLARLSHPNLLALYEFGSAEDGRAYMALEWIDNGRSLEDLMAGHNRFAWTEAARVGRAVAAALACAHEQGVLHRDIKPSNILIPPAGLDSAKLSDFGVLGALDEQDDRLGRTTQVGVVAGTPMYMAPEQFSGQRLSSRSDLYSLAVVMRNMLWPADPASLSLTAILVERLQQSGRIPDDPAVPPPLRQLLRDMLQRDPEQRAASAAAVASALNGLINDSTLAPVGGPEMTRGDMASASPATGRPTSAPPAWVPRHDSVTWSRDSGAEIVAAAPAVASAAPPRSILWAAIALLAVATVALMFIAAPRVAQVWQQLPVATAAIAQGVGLMAGGLLVGVLLSRAIEQRRTVLERNVSLALTGSKDRANLSRTMIMTVDAIIQQTSKLDARFLGATIIGMVREYDDAKESSDKQQALVRATELLEKLLEKTSPWYVRNSKWVVAAASLVGLIGGASKLVGEALALLR